MSDAEWNCNNLVLSFCLLKEGTISVFQAVDLDSHRKFIFAFRGRSDATRPYLSWVHPRPLSLHPPTIFPPRSLYTIRKMAIPAHLTLESVRTLKDLTLQFAANIDEVQPQYSLLAQHGLQSHKGRALFLSTQLQALEHDVGSRMTRDGWVENNPDLKLLELQAFAYHTGQKH